MNLNIPDTADGYSRTRSEISFQHIAHGAATFLVFSFLVYFIFQSKLFNIFCTNLTGTTPTSIAMKQSLSGAAQQPSYIPAYYQGTVKQTLAPTILRKKNWLSSNEEEGYLEKSIQSMVVLDKVVIVPKVIAQRIKNLPDNKEGENNDTALINAANSHYTIQLIASRNKNKLVHFARQHHLTGKTEILRTEKEGVSWYVLTLGEYSERHFAWEALQKLPTRLGKHKPWIRSLAQLKKSGSTDANIG